MCDEHARQRPSRGWRRSMLLALLVGAAAVGCHNSCVTFVWNFGGTTPVTPPSCSLTKASAVVDLRLTSIPAADTGTATHPRHLFLTIRGIQALPREASGEEPSDWVDLAPRLISHPLQVDLMEQADDSCRLGLLSGNVVVAGVYTQIRLRLLTTQQIASGPAPQEDACGALGFNCIVAADGSARPLVFDSQTQEIPIRSDGIRGGFFQILPETHTSLALEFNPYASRMFAAAEAVRLSPVFTLEVRPPCDSAAR